MSNTQGSGIVNKAAKKYFEDFETDVKRYKDAVSKALQNYVKDREEAKDSLNEKHLQPRLEQLRFAAKNSIEYEFSCLHHMWNECYVPLLYEALWDHIKQEPPKAAMDRLRIYNEFNIAMSKTDASYFLHELSGTHAGVLALAAVAKRSGLNVKAPDISQYEGEIEEIGKGVCNLSRYCPEGYWQDFAELNIETTNIDSLAFDPNRPGHRGLAVAQNDEFISGLQKIAHRWSTNFVPELIDDAAMNDEEREQAMQEHAEALEAAADQIEISDNADIEFGKAHGKQKADSAQRAVETIAHYAR